MHVGKMLLIKHLVLDSTVSGFHLSQRLRMMWPSMGMINVLGL
jgi:hypothetical protein